MDKAAETSESSEDPGLFFEVISRYYTEFEEDNIELEGIKGFMNGFKTDMCASELLLRNKTRIDFFYNNKKNLLVLSLRNGKVLNLDHKSIIDFLGLDKEMIEASLWNPDKSYVTQSASLFKVTEPIYQGKTIGKLKAKYEETVALEEPDTLQEIFSVTVTNYRKTPLEYALVIRPTRRVDEKLVIDKHLFEEPDLYITVSPEKTQKLFFYTQPRHVPFKQPKKRKSKETSITPSWTYGLYLDLKKPVSDSENIITCSDQFINPQTRAFKPAVLDKGSNVRPYKCDFTRKVKVNEDRFFKISYQTTNLYIRLEDILTLNKVKNRLEEIHSQKPYEQVKETEITVSKQIISLKTQNTLPHKLDI